jgi:shikimate kinase
VLATGGGAFIELRTRAEIKARATSVWLRADLDLLWDRVRDRPGRPLLQAPDPRAVLADLDRRRAPLYAEADVIVDSRRGASHEAMAREIIAAVRACDAARAGRAATIEPVP